MNLTLSPQMKIVALVGAVAVLGLGGFMMTMGRAKTEDFNAPYTTTAAAVTNAAVPKVAATKPAKHATPAKAKAHAKPAAAAKPVVHKAAPKPKAKPKPKPAVAPNGLPTPLDELLHGHRIVVVALWDPEIPSDKLSILEAAAGAHDANAGFLPVSVLNERVASPLTNVAGGGTLLPSPGLLIYKQPATLMNRISGFSDREAVAEAVANALLADSPAPGVIPNAVPIPTATPTDPAAAAATPATDTTGD